MPWTELLCVIISLMLTDLQWTASTAFVLPLGCCLSYFFPLGRWAVFLLSAKAIGKVVWIFSGISWQSPRIHLSGARVIKVTDWWWWQIWVCLLHVNTCTLETGPKTCIFCRSLALASCLIDYLPVAASGWVTGTLQKLPDRMWMLFSYPWPKLFRASR